MPLQPIADGIVAKLEARSSQDLISCFLGYLVDVICFEAESLPVACSMALKWTQLREESKSHGNLPVAAFRIGQRETGLCEDPRTLRDALSAVIDPIRHFSKLVLLPEDTDDTQVRALLHVEAIAARRRRSRSGYRWTGHTLKQVGHGLVQQLATVRHLGDVNCINALETRRLPQPLLGQDLRLGELWSGWLGRKHDMLHHRSGRLSILARCLGMDLATMYEGMTTSPSRSPADS